jgi:hypothetical protein
LSCLFCTVIVFLFYPLYQRETLKFLLHLPPLRLPSLVALLPCMWLSDHFLLVRLSSWCFWKLRSPVCGQEADGASLQPRDTSPARDYGEQDQATVVNLLVCS